MKIIPWFRRRRPPAVERDALEWIDSIDRDEKVGTRHHSVPRFYLARFADERGQLRVRDRTSGAESKRNIKDLAIKDFYTFINGDGNLDSSIEQLLSVVEDRAAAILVTHLDGDDNARAFTVQEREWIDAFVAFQSFRGQRQRRVIELITDYSEKLFKQHVLTDEDLRSIEFVPHQNDHMAMMPAIVSKIEGNLNERPVAIIELEHSGLVTCDEPVLLEGGFARAEAIFVPLSPRQSLVYGTRGGSWAAHHFPLTGGEAQDFAGDILALSLRNSLDWIAAHPDHVAFASMTMPPAEPLLRITDGESVMSQQLREPGRRRPIRLRPHSDSSRDESASPDS